MWEEGKLMNIAVIILAAAVSFQTAPADRTYTQGFVSEEFYAEQNRGNLNRIGWGDNREFVIYRNGEPDDILESNGEAVLKYYALGSAIYYENGQEKGELIDEGLNVTFYINEGKHTQIPNGVYKVAFIDNGGYITAQDVINEFGKPSIEKDSNLYYSTQQYKHNLFYFKYDENNNIIEYGITLYSAENF